MASPALKKWGGFGWYGIGFHSQSTPWLCGCVGPRTFWFTSDRTVLETFSSVAKGLHLSVFCFSFQVNNKPKNDTKKNNEQSLEHHQHHHHHNEVYNFIYILHPKAVTGFSWRQKSKRMPQWVYNWYYVKTIRSFCSGLVIFWETVMQSITFFCRSILYSLCREGIYLGTLQRKSLFLLFRRTGEHLERY